MKNKNTVFSFFASVKLALVTLSLLSVTSIIGTVIPQKETIDWYIQNYSDTTARIFQVLDIPDMYNSWWFLGLLGILATNLIICSIDRFPGVWKQIKADNLATNLKRLRRMRLSSTWTSDKSRESLSTKLSNSLASRGWKTKQRQRDNALLLFAQKGAMTRTGVYIVHTSILVIFIGAIIGEMYGFKGSVMLPETQSTNSIYQFETEKPIDLGFTLRCDRFDIEFYDSGMPKAYRSKLSIFENEKLIIEKDIVVNDPLTYKGITFYQASYQGYDNFILTITNQQSGVSETSTMPFQQQMSLTQHKGKIGIINAETTGQTVTRMKVWFKDDLGPASTFWINAGDQVTVERPDAKYTIAAKQMYATGLQVARDPGVYVVYLGCFLMILGLFIAFFMSHRRIWLLLDTDENGDPTILMSGSANKNKFGFEKNFASLCEEMQKSVK
jgi:cytochrome c biogenesis protein